MPTLLLIRHGETDWNRSGQIMGNQPIPLNQYGIDQVQALAEILKTRTIQKIYASPVARTLQTAELLSTAVKQPVHTHEGLTEINVGEWVGRFWSEFSEDIIKQNFYLDPEHARPPGGETLHDVQQRAVGFVEDMLKHHQQDTGNEQDLVLLISHADVLRTILAHYLRWDLKTIREVRIDHASLTALRVHSTLTDLICVNFTSSLSGLR